MTDYETSTMDGSDGARNLPLLGEALDFDDKT